jgi:hypothetical protein
VAQPALGLVASAIVMAIALGFISLFDFPAFSGWVAFFMLGLIPMQIVIVVSWAANPSFAARLGQPIKGVVLVLVTIVAALVAAPLTLQLVGESVTPPGPIPTHYAIIVVPTTFWLAIMFGGWPFTTLFKKPIAAGLALLVASYVVTYAVFRVFFNYSFMSEAPVYLSSAPGGMYNAVAALVFYVTALAVMFLVLCFDLWPLTKFAGVMKQPVLGVVWTGIALVGTAVALWIGVETQGDDPMSFLTDMSAPFIFGSIIVLNMLQNSLFAKMSQPLKGVMNAIAAAAIGLGLAHVYVSLAPTVTARLASGPPGYEQEIWLANALLSVTFPFLIFHAAFFGYWPIPVKGSRPETPRKA